MSENPALEWNSLDKTHDSVKSRPKVQPIVTGINSRLNFAPAIVYRKVMDKRLVLSFSKLIFLVNFSKNQFTLFS